MAECQGLCRLRQVTAAHLIVESERLTSPASVEQLFAFNYALPSTPSSSKTTLPPRDESTISQDSPLSSSPTKQSSSTPTGTSSPKPTGWQTYNPRTEFTRQGVGSRTRGWRFTDINKDYSFSATYPSKLVVPNRIGDAVLQYAAKYRSKARIPALTYLHWANNVGPSQVACVHLTVILIPHAGFHHSIIPTDGRTERSPISPGREAGRVYIRITSVSRGLLYQPFNDTSASTACLRLDHHESHHRRPSNYKRHGQRCHGSRNREYGALQIW